MTDIYMADAWDAFEEILDSINEMNFHADHIVPILDKLYKEAYESGYKDAKSEITSTQPSSTEPVKTQIYDFT